MSDDVKVINLTDSLRVRIQYDLCAQNPWQEYDMVGSYCFFGNKAHLNKKGADRYSDVESFLESFYSGDREHEVSEEELIEWFGSNYYVAYLQLRDYDGSLSGLNQYPKRSVVDGVYYISIAEAAEEWGADADGKATAYLKSVVEEQSQYFQGNVYGYATEAYDKCDCCGRGEWNEQDSCWGFYGEWSKSGIVEAIIDSIPEKDSSEEVIEKIKTTLSQGGN